MIRHMRADEAVRIKYDSKYAQSSNYWKNSLGMNKCIDSVGIIRQKADFEDRIQEYQKWTGYLKGKLDFEKMRTSTPHASTPTNSAPYGARHSHAPASSTHVLSRSSA